MNIDKEMMELIFEIEHIIGQECFNPHSYDGYTGEEGKEFRYPVWADASQNKDIENERRFYGKISNVLPENISSIKYKFGANHLYVGIAIKKILELLEKKYGINFYELNLKMLKK